MSAAQAMEIKNISLKGKVRDLFNITREFVALEEEDRYLNDEFHALFNEIYNGKINERLDL